MLLKRLLFRRKLFPATLTLKCAPEYKHCDPNFIEYPFAKGVMGDEIRDQKLSQLYGSNP